MRPEETIKIAIHCFGVQAEQEVCEECPVYLESGIACREVARVAISALKEVQQYREIGTVKECREAMEKQTPKAPDYEGDGYDNKGELIYDTWICPNCGERYEVDYDDYEHCPKCGQAIDTENLEEMEDERD